MGDRGGCCFGQYGHGVVGERVADVEQHRVQRARLRLEVRQLGRLRRLRVRRGHRLLSAFPLERDADHCAQRFRVGRRCPSGIYRC